MSEIISTREMLIEVQQTIMAVLKGQAYSYKGRTMTMADLGELRKMERELKYDLSLEESNDNGIYHGTFCS